MTYGDRLIVAEYFGQQKKVRDRKDNRGWTTESELKYLNNIGRYHPENGKTTFDFLSAYINAAKKRVVWCGIDKRQVLLRATELLHREMTQ